MSKITCPGCSTEVELDKNDTVVCPVCGEVLKFGKSADIVISYNTDSESEKIIANRIYNICSKKSYISIKVAPLTSVDAKTAKIMFIVATTDEDLLNTSNKSIWSIFVEECNNDFDKKFVVFGNELSRSTLINELRIVSKFNYDEASIKSVISDINKLYDNPSENINDEVEDNEYEETQKPSNKVSTSSGRDCYHFVFIDSETFDIEVDRSTSTYYFNVFEDDERRQNSFSVKDINRVDIQVSDTFLGLMIWSDRFRGSRADEEYSNLTCDIEYAELYYDFLLKLLNDLKVNNVSYVCDDEKELVETVKKLAENGPIDSDDIEDNTNSNVSNIHVEETLADPEEVANKFSRKSYSWTFVTTQRYSVSINKEDLSLTCSATKDRVTKTNSFYLKDITKLNFEGTFGSYYSIYIYSDNYTGEREYQYFAHLTCDADQSGSFKTFVLELEAALIALGVKFTFGKREELMKISSYSSSSTSTTITKKSGCYVATCVYNSYDCPQVWRLRRYRDNYLKAHWWGRAFIKIYYGVSPTLVKWFGEKKWFRNPIKKKLDKMVLKLEKKGYSDTPYTDNNTK